MAARNIDGPLKNWLTIQELANEIGIGETAIRERLKAKKFPKARRFGDKKVWSWRVVVWWELNAEYGEEEDSDPSEEENTGGDFAAPSRAKPRQGSPAPKEAT